MSYEENRPKLLILGYGRHGKDTVAEMLRDQYGLNFMSSSEFVAREILWDNWGSAVYGTFEEMFEDRHNHRVLWMQMISAYNTPDKTKTAQTMLGRDGFDMYVGMRRQDELDACIQQELFDMIIWVDRSEHHPVETGSMDITPTSSNADWVIDNNGTMEDLEQNVADLVHILTTEHGFHWRLPEDEEETSLLTQLKKVAESEEMTFEEAREIYTPGPRQAVAEYPSPVPVMDVESVSAPDEVDLLERPDDSVAVLDHGYVSLVDTFGTDSDIAEAARLSYGRGTKKVNKNEGLIKYLYSNHHTSPFEMVEMKFQMRLPIFVMRQWVRHRTANLNEYSGRYSVMPRLWYVPEAHDIKGQDKTNKQASDGTFDFGIATEIQSRIDRASEAAFEEYEELLVMGLSREMARIILPLNMYTEIVWKMDLNNMLKFLWLRDDGHAQPEIQAYAKVIAAFVEEKFPVTYAAYLESRESVTLTKTELLSLMTGDKSRLSKSQTKKHEQILLDVREEVGNWLSQPE